MLSFRRTYIVAVFLLVISATAFAQDQAIKPAIILGHYPVDSITPTEQQTARCLKAFELFNAGKINRIVVSGGFTRGHISEGAMMGIALVAFGVPEEYVIQEARSSTTIENAFFVDKVFAELEWKKRAVLISQSYHLIRADSIFKDSGFDIKSVTAKNGVGKEDYGILDNPVVDFSEAGADGKIILFESYDSKEPQSFPLPEQAARLRAVAAAYREGSVKQITILTDWYTRGPVDLSETFHVALVSLGVSPKDIDIKNNLHYSDIETLAKMAKETGVAIFSSQEVKSKIAESYPEIKVISM